MSTTVAVFAGILGGMALMAVVAGCWFLKSWWPK